MRRNKELNGKKIKGGTTVVTALIIESLLYIAHAGDSRAVLYAVEETEEVLDCSSIFGPISQLEETYSGLAATNGHD